MAEQHISQKYLSMKNRHHCLLTYESDEKLQQSCDMATQEYIFFWSICLGIPKIV